MISPEICSHLATYWKAKNVICQKAEMRGPLSGTELATLWESVGMPRQEWWPFRFKVPSFPAGEQDVAFGAVGNWELYYRYAENLCFATGKKRKERFANSSFAAFMQLLVLFDECCVRIEEQCPTDSGTDADRAQSIICETEAAMRVVDSRAFENDSNLWPNLLID
jgi:SUKH-4 immunity protein